MSCNTFTLTKLAAPLGLSIVAQGGEFQLQIEYIKSRSCDLYQGFYLSKPIAESDWLSLLIRRAQTGQAKGK
jgi:EAL domain-containing protein (putative c-di-GMP-specific phosphodiesterase class I)